jgi:hypothetical protein
VQITLDDGVASARARNLDLLALDGALDELHGARPARRRGWWRCASSAASRSTRRPFALGLSSATVEREWATARAWLFQRLADHAPSA